MQKNTIAQHFNAFSKGLENINQNLKFMRQIQLATAGFRSAIGTEQSILESLVVMAELDQRCEAMSHEERKIYDELSAKMKDSGEDETPLSEMCKWSEIIKPAPVEDAEIQRRIEAEYEDAMDERNKWLEKLKERCAKDAVFARLLCGKMVEAKYPKKYTLKIVPLSLYAKYSDQD